MDFIEDWETAERPLLIVDEVRPDGDPGVQYIFYVGVLTNTKTAVEWARQGLLTREHLPVANRETVYKGKNIFPRGGQPRMPMAGFVMHCLSTSDGIVMMATSNKRLKEQNGVLTGGIRVEDPHDPQAPLALRSGPELVPILNFFKKVALDRKLGAVQMDVLLDRSRQLGFDARSTGVAQGQFQAYGPATFNTMPDGSLAALQCPTAFRIIPVPEEGKFKDLMLLPDAAAYVGAFHGSAFDNAKAKVDAGEAFWVWWADMDPIRAPGWAGAPTGHEG